MSRSNPTDNSPNPCTRWFEWDGANGHPRYYSKREQKNIDLPADLTFILLDQLGTIKGWHEVSESGIYSNEVKDTRSDAFVVKAFKGGPIATGVYAAIKDRVAASGGYFVANCYIAYKEGDQMRLGSIQFKGASLGVWMEFCKVNRAELYNKAIHIKGYTEAKKGKVTYRTPVFFLRDITADTNTVALDIDKELQTYLKGYFSRTKVEQVTKPVTTAPHDASEPPLEELPIDHSEGSQVTPEDDSNIPF